MTRSKKPLARPKLLAVLTKIAKPFAIGVAGSLVAALIWYVFVTIPDAKSRSQAGILRSQWVFSFFKPVAPKLAFGSSVLSLIGEAAEKGFLRFYDDTFHVWIRWGKLRVSAKVRTENGNEVLEIRDNEWVVNPNEIFDRNFTNNALEVRNRGGETVFHILLCGEAAAFEARFFNGSGDALAIASPGNPPRGPIFEIRHFGLPLETHLGEWFLYPSTLHPGEMRASEKDLCKLYTRMTAAGEPFADSSLFATMPHSGPIVKVQ